MHCLRGEDESFGICESTFPEEATITCIENRQPGFDIWIKAIPCDGIWECRNGSDEVNCEGNMYNLILIVVLLVIFTNCIYFYLKLMMLPQWKIDFQSKDDDNDDNWNPDFCQTYNGDKLANLKVSVENLLILCQLLLDNKNIIIQNETSQKRCAELLKKRSGQEGLFGKIKASFKE